ncbi:MAG: hypothetical protein IKO64_05520 [Kiritimatiellae bacterium]|nr:hypothetical protein [Kiritimatiellia bacterium]
MNAETLPMLIRIDEMITALRDIGRRADAALRGPKLYPEEFERRLNKALAGIELRAHRARFAGAGTKTHTESRVPRDSGLAAGETARG